MQTETYIGCAHCEMQWPSGGQQSGICPNCEEPTEGKLYTISSTSAGPTPTRASTELPDPQASPRKSQIVHVRVFHRASRTTAEIGVDAVKWRKAVAGNLGSRGSIMLGQATKALRRVNPQINSAFWDDCDLTVLK